MTAISSCQLIFQEVREDQKMEEYTIVANTKGKADVWRHFGLRKRKADGTIVEKTVCLTCNTVVKTSGCTINMMTHIRRVHPQLLSSRTTVQATTDPTIEAGPSERRQQTRQKQQTLQGVLAAQEKKTKYPLQSTRAQAIMTEIARFLVKDMRPYSLVESLHFRSLLATMDERYQTPSRSYFSKTAIPSMYDELKTKVLGMLVILVYNMNHF